jgi:3-isopropylmalate dehydrogenase
MAHESINLAVIGGDGIGPEVTAQALRVLDAVLTSAGEQLETTHYALGAEHWLATGETLTEETLEALTQHDAILFGAVGAHPSDTTIPSGLLERDILLKLRFSLDHGVNLRPSVLYPGIESPLKDAGEIDFVVVREGTEGPYVGNGGVIRQGTAHEIATEVSLNTDHGVRRVVTDAFERAMQRRKKLTLVHKHNVLVNAGGLWKRVVAEVGADFPEVSVDYQHVDAATIFMVTDPARYDVIVTDNLFGDILTDLAGAVTGGIGLAASGNINPSREFPSMFEPVHGSAPDIAGQDIADPRAAILSGALLLDHLERPALADRIRQAVRDDVVRHAALRDESAEGASAARGTEEIGSAIVAALTRAHALS